MSGFKGIAKGGWHPKGKDGGKESWRGDFKGIDQVAGWMGKKKKSDAEEAAEHASTPLNQLQDPASFGPPPKRTTFGAAGASSPTAAQPAPQIQGSRLTASTGGIGAPLSREQVEESRKLTRERAEAKRIEEEEPKYPTGPYKTDTTGLSTAGFAAPPKFRGASAAAEGGAPAPAAAKPKPPPPSLPPRLPPRQAASPPPAYTSPYAQQADPENGVLNQSAMSRLGAAGVQVPGLGIGNGNGATSPPVPARSPSTNTGPSAGQLSELKSRFSRLNSSSASAASPSAGAASTGGGTSWAQKQAALKTAGDFHKDPSSVSLSDARSAASTANNFRERHGDQVASGWKAASGLNQKYGISDRFGGNGAAAAPQESSAPLSPGKKKPPPPPPAKKLNLQAGGPPAINMGNKPSFP